MLENRDYMRRPEYDEPNWFSRLGLYWSLTLVVLLINLIIFILVEINKAYTPIGFAKIVQYGALSNEGISHGYVWQYLTFQFLHLGRTHFLFNMLGLFFLGRAIESIVGAKRFIVLYVASGLVGGAFQTLLGLLFPNIFGLPVVGASAGVLGLLAALAVFQPNSEVLVFFILPVKIKYCAIAAAIVAFFYIIVPAEPGIAHAAHLGGMAMGWFYVKYILKNPALIGMEERAEPRPVMKVEELSTGDFLESEVDPILDKISAHGIKSLTARERAILESARKKMTR